jgi:hypothetical protein
VKLKFAIFAGIVGSLASVEQAIAHHSFAAEFDGMKAVRLVGKLTKIEWTNPHSYFYLDVTSDNGKVSNWGCEAGAPGALSRRGFKKGDILRRISRRRQSSRHRADADKVINQARRLLESALAGVEIRGSLAS